MMWRPDCGPSTEGLSTRANVVTLAAAAADVELLRWEMAEAPAWVLVDVASLSSRPFLGFADVQRGGGVAPTARFASSRSATFCVFARSIRLLATNVATEANQIAARVQPVSQPVDLGVGAVELAEQVTWPAAADPTLTIAVPPYAATVRVDLGPGPLAISPLPYIDIAEERATGVYDVVYRAPVRQPLLTSTGDVPVGGASVVQLTPGLAGDGGAARVGRITFGLALR